MEQSIIESVQGAIETDEESQGYFQAYDDIDQLRWELPNGWEAKDYIRKRVSTIGHDGLKSLDSLFDTHNPKFEILPRTEADKDNAEEMEVWLEWHMKRANQIGDKSPFRQALHSSGKYSRVILQVDYLPYWLPEKKKWTPEQKAAAKAGPFCITVHNPRNVYYEMGKYGLKWVASVTKLYGQEIINHWSVYGGEGDEGKKVKSAIKKIEKDIENDSEACYIHIDYISFEKRSVACFKAESLEQFEDMNSDTDHISLVDTDNKLGFINWSVAIGESDPLLHSMHISGSWENQNLIDTLIDSSVLRRAFFPILKHTSMGGTKELDVNYDGTQDTIELANGEDAQTLQPPPIDTAITQLASVNTDRISQNLGIRNLQSMQMSGNVQFSTMNAFIQLQMAALEPYKRTTEKAWEQAAEIMFKWVEKTKDTVTGYRTKSKGEGKKSAGSSITMTADDFEIEDLHIKCELIANTPTDKMQQVNMYSALKQAGAQIGWGELLERLGLGNPEVLKRDWMNEQLEGVAMQNFVEKLKAEIQMEIQAKTMQMQSQLQQEQMMQQQAMQMQQQAMQAPQGAPQSAMPQEQAGPPNMPQGDAVMPEGQMNDPAAGGLPPMMSAAGMTRNQVNGGQ